LVTTTNYDALGWDRLVVDELGNRVQKAYRFGTGESYEFGSNPYLASKLTDSTMGWMLTTRDSVGRVKTGQSYPSRAEQHRPEKDWSHTN
jgi:hypothetical protein